MLLFLVSLVISIAILFAGIPSAINKANIEHIKNGREPNAGIAFMPDLIMFVVIWWGASTALKHFLGLTTALIIVITFFTLIFLWSIHIARKSNKEYALFIEEHKMQSNEA